MVSPFRIIPAFHLPLPASSRTLLLQPRFCCRHTRTMSSRPPTRESRKRLRQGTLSNLAGIPEGVPKRSRRDSEPAGVWKDDQSGLLFFEPASWNTPSSVLGKPQSPIKIAAFDLDSTLICTKTRAKFPKNPSDWRLLNAKVAPAFAKLAAEDYVMVIFTNQAGVSNGRITESFVKLRLSGILTQLKEPIGVLVATGKDNYRKPATGMWDFLMQKVGGSHLVDKDNSFYVGDAAGRPARMGAPKDFSDSDLKFSINIGLSFKTPEQYFLGKQSEGVSSSNIKGFDPRAMIASPKYGETYIDDSTDMDMLLGKLVTPIAVVQELHHGGSASTALPDVQTMVLMHGFPASGKTVFCKRHLIPRGYEWINQDTLHTYAQCARATKAALASGKSVVIDNTNPNAKARKKYIDMAKAHNPDMKVLCLVMTTTKEVSQHLNVVRERRTMGARAKVPVVAYHAFSKVRQLPEESERIDMIGEVRFLPSFASQQESYYFTRLS